MMIMFEAPFMHIEKIVFGLLGLGKLPQIVKYKTIWNIKLLFCNIKFGGLDDNMHNICINIFLQRQQFVFVFNTSPDNPGDKIFCVYFTLTTLTISTSKKADFNV